MSEVLVPILIAIASGLALVRFRPNWPGEVVRGLERAMEWMSRPIRKVVDKVWP